MRQTGYTPTWNLCNSHKVGLSTLFPCSYLQYKPEDKKDIYNLLQEQSGE